ncbi:MAG: hypothetical protein Q8R04_00650 [Nanoarchaeota archaeon]|nr:hypothetical protein [Nanoarchaeota archaeon]
MEAITVNSTNTEKKLESIGWTPLHTRLLAHRIGDGSVNHYGHYEYNNNHVDEFLDLANFLKIKYWGPVVSDKYGTRKVIIPKKTFRDFASVFNVNYEELIKNPVLLLEVIANLPEEHRLQAILAFIVDDGSCKSWLLTVFEDQNENVFNKVKELWEGIFPETSKIYTYTTKAGTKVYHLMVNRNGIISLALRIKNSTNKHGKLANLWWKQRDFNYRYEIAISKRALNLSETSKNHKNREKIILDYLKENNHLTFKEAQKILNLNRDRARYFFDKLIKDKKLFVIDAGNKSRYSVKFEDISLEARSRLIVEYLSHNKRIFNKDCRKLLNLGDGQSYKILKMISNQGITKQIKEKGITYYTLP